MLKHNRVIVRLINENSGVQDDRNRKQSRLLPLNKHDIAASASGPDPEVKCVDEHTIKLTPPDLSSAEGEQMYFDCVGRQDDENVRAEFQQAIEQLLRWERNCCLVHFNATKRNPNLLLGDLLVNEVEQQLRLLHGSIYSIQWVFSDILKSDLAKPSDKAAQLKKRPAVRGRLHNTLELRNWLRTEYCALWSLGSGHNSLDLQFTYADKNHRLHKAKFVFYHLNFSKIGQKAQVMLRTFLQKIGDICVNKLMQHSALIQCLQEYFNGVDVWYNCLLFDVPNDAKAAKEMLILASDANEACDKSSELHSIDSYLQSMPQSIPTAPAKVSLRSKGGASRRQNDINESLNHWYNKINEKYCLAMRAMDRFYACKYKARGEQTDGIVRNLAHRVDAALRQFNTMPGQRHQEDAELRTSYKQYQDAADLFHKVCFDAEISKYSELLKGFLQSKKHTFSQNTINLKMQHLKECQECLVGQKN